MKDCFDEIALYRRWKIECRKEDVIYLQEQNVRIDENVARRLITEKAQVLRNISILSALLLGFAMISQTNVGIPNQLSTQQLIPFAVLTATSISAFVIAMLNSTFLLLAVYRYDWTSVHSNSMTFLEYWDKLCYRDWKVAIYSFTYGVIVFLGMQTSLGWVSLYGLKGVDIASWLNAAISMVTIIIVICLFRRQLMRQGRLTINNQYDHNLLASQQQQSERQSLSDIYKEGSESNISALNGGNRHRHLQASL